jgi:uncharacterized protein YkwD
MRIFRFNANKKSSYGPAKRQGFLHGNALIFILIFVVIGSMGIWHSEAANPALPGDVNNDNKVDLTDLSILLSNYATTNSSADLDGNSKVDIIDLSILLSNYGQSLAGQPTVTISANPNTINTGSSSTLSWSSTNATSCTASGGWNGSKPSSGSQSTGALNATTTYTLTCSGSGGSQSNSVTVTVDSSGSELASESTCPNQTSTSATVAQKNLAMICMTNYGRNFNGGLSALAQNTALMNASSSKANDIITCNEFSHTACGRQFQYWILQYGYTGNCYGENIAQGYQTVRDTFSAWMSSAGHRANILNSNYRDIGVAVQGSGSQMTWVMQLGGC